MHAVHIGKGDPAACELLACMHTWGMASVARSTRAPTTPIAAAPSCSSSVRCRCRLGAEVSPVQANTDSKSTHFCTTYQRSNAMPCKLARQVQGHRAMRPPQQCKPHTVQAHCLRYSVSCARAIQDSVLQSRRLQD